jgi:hypothetical protein
VNTLVDDGADAPDILFPVPKVEVGGSGSIKFPDPDLAQSIEENVDASLWRLQIEVDELKLSSA